MADLKISIILVLSFAILGVSGYSCVCYPDKCEDSINAVNCDAGFVKDACGCCNICAKKLGETCGGPWDSTGKCGDDFKCEKQPEQGGYSNHFNTKGKCILKNPVINPNWFYGFDLTGMGGIDFSGFSGSEFTISKGVMYLNGIEIGGGKEDCYRSCYRIFKPVCGSDGKTYPNECALSNVQCERNQNLMLTQHSPCDIKPSVDPVFCFKSMCTSDYKPVCGSDGETYSNECELNNAKCDKKALKKVHNSLCVKVIATSCTTPSCNIQYKPLCSSDGETYGSECLFNNAKCADKKLTIVSRSVCSMTTTSTTYFKISINNGFDLSDFSGLQLSGFKGYSFQIENGLTLLNGLNLGGSQCYTACLLKYMPVCGSDDNNYLNNCALQNEKCDNFGLYKRYNGKCKGDIQYPEGTTCIIAKCKGNLDDSFKVCGNDGNTYESYCDFLNAKCKNTFLELADIGPCVGIVGPIECTTPCQLIDKPVCGSDGVTYSNDCFLKNAKCDNIFLYKVSDEPCGDCKSEICSLEIFPICGSDGRTYGNQCMFKKAQCNNASLTKKYNGECAEVTPFCVSRLCLERYQPVCGSDGQTYSSQCHLNNAKCENNLLKLSYNGPCEILWRFDFRCGRNYPLSSSKPAQCNPNSENAYCCSASGWCGHTDFHCSCKDCANYKKINLDSLLLSAVTQLQGTCGHANDCRTTLQTLEQFVGLQKEHIRLLHHNDDLMSKRLLELEHQTRGASRKLTNLVAYHFDCQPPFVFLDTKECLYFHTEPKTYDQAKSVCAIQSAEIAIPANFELLSISMKENGFGDTPETYPFIGAISSSEGNYVWENNTAIKTDNWDSKSDMFGLCVVYCPTCLSKSPLIADSSTACTTRRPFICEKKGNVVSTTISLSNNNNNNNGNASPLIPMVVGGGTDENIASAQAAAQAAIAAAIAQAAQDGTLQSGTLQSGLLSNIAG